nr:immunoglobulin heavy chain junction region [Mus musculus]
CAIGGAYYSNFYFDYW